MSVHRKTPVVFRHPGDDPLKDRRAIDDVSRRKIVILLIGSVLVCGFILGGVSSAVVLAMTSDRSEGTILVEALPTLAVLPSVTMTLVMEATAEVEETEVVKATAEVTEPADTLIEPTALSANAMTATAEFRETPMDEPTTIPTSHNPYLVSGGPSSSTVGGGVRVVTAAPQVIVRTVMAPPQIVTRQVIYQVPVVVTATFTYTPPVEQTEAVTVSPEFTSTWTTTPSPTVTPTLTETLMPTWTETPLPTWTPTDIPTEMPVELPTEVWMQYPTEIPINLPTETPPETTVEPDSSVEMHDQG